MKTMKTDPRTRQQALRLWPGVAILIVQWLGRFVLPKLVPEAEPIGAMASLFGGVAIVIWWAFFSRAPRADRGIAILLMIAALFGTSRILDESLATAGMGFLFFIYAIPVLCLALVVWAAATRNLPNGPRRATLVATILLATGVWALVRTGGVRGGGGSEFAWRWTPTAEEQLLAQGDDKPLARRAAPLPAETGADWPGFRGPNRDSIIHGVQLATDWTTSPPVELWRRPIGPGWSSFAVHGDFIYTQEQRGEDEVVACYSATTGEPVWRHQDNARFWESNAGPGPRATPTLRGDRVYTFGATGILNALDAQDGTVVWSRDVVSDQDVKIPGWGFSSSPLVTDDLVIVHARGLSAYDRTTGEPRWAGPRTGGYSSPQLMTIDGVSQVVLLAGAGASGVAPADGTVLWEHPWTGGIVQPALTANGEVLVSSSGITGGLGLRRIAVAQSASGWTAEERWTSIRLKPNFNDFVVHEGSAFGFDGSILASIDLEDGERHWKGGRYGNGQLLLMADQDVLLVLSEKGYLALVSATSDQFTELARFPVIEGKTWNHPVLVGDLLLVRNSQEMAALRLPLA